MATDEGPSCVCRCGERTKGGDFLPGHDAKHKGNLIREAIAGGNPDAEIELERRGWTKFLNKRREVLARPTAEPKPKPVNLGNLQILWVMRAAAKVLKATGHYNKVLGGQPNPHHIEIRVDNMLPILELQHPKMDLSGLPELPTLEVRARHFHWLPEEEAAVRAFLLAPS